MLRMRALIRKPGVHVHVDYLQESGGERDGTPLKQRSFQSTIPDTQGQTINKFSAYCGVATVMVLLGRRLPDLDATISPG